jgi:hypothetical protein
MAAAGKVMACRRNDEGLRGDMAMACRRHGDGRVLSGDDVPTTLSLSSSRACMS